MRVAILSLILAVSPVHAKLDLAKIMAESNKAQSQPKSKRKSNSNNIVKGEHYLWYYQLEDGQWYTQEVIATGRFVNDCNGNVLFEILDLNDGETTFSEPKYLTRIHSTRPTR